MPQVRRKKPPLWLQVSWIRLNPPQWIQLAVARGAKRDQALRVNYRPDHKAATSSILLAYRKAKKKKPIKKKTIKKKPP